MLAMTCCKMNPDLVPFKQLVAEMTLHAADHVLMAFSYNLLRTVLCTAHAGTHTTPCLTFFCEVEVIRL